MLAGLRRSPRCMAAMRRASNNARFPTVEQFRRRLPTTALSFRGYNVTNLGRTPELLAHPRYSGIMTEWLRRGSALCGDVLQRDVDLVARVRERRETSLASYGEAIVLVVAVSLAQLELLQREFDVDWQGARLSFGYSLGEITAVIAGGAVTMEEALRVPLQLAADCVDLTPDCTLAVLFSRRGIVAPVEVDRLCQTINQRGEGVIGISAILSPNSLLVMGQGTTMDRLAAEMKSVGSERLYLRRNEHRWPPLHTAIVWQRGVPCRSRVRLQTMQISGKPPRPPVFSLVTGAMGYQNHDLRNLFGQWIDHPQRLWTAVEHSLANGVTDVVHVGPEPNIVPATFERLAQNVESELRFRRPIRALSRMAARPWLQRLLPRRATLLRAPHVRQLNLEDWLLER